MLLRQIVIPDYPDRVMISKARRPVYYTKDNAQNIPKSFKDTKKYVFDPQGRLIDKRTGEFKIKNSKTAGQPRYWRVNFQEIWNGAIAKHGRNSRVEKLKEVFRPYIESIEPLGDLDYPIGMEILIYDTEFPIDVSNRGVIYTKVIEDLLVRCEKIVDDGAYWVTDSGRTRYVKVDAIAERKMVINIFKSSYSESTNRV